MSPYPLVDGLLWIARALLPWFFKPLQSQGIPHEENNEKQRGCRKTESVKAARYLFR